MTKIILLSVLLFASNLTYAGNSHDEGRNNNAPNYSQGQIQLQGQGQSNSVSTTVNGDNIDIPASSAYAPSMSPSAQCMGVASGGLQVPAFGFSMGKSYESKPCNQRELVRVLHSLNQDTAAIEVACSIEGAEVTTLCKGLKSNK